MKNLPARHGDLSFHVLKKLPKGAKFIRKAPMHIAGLGETTGHKHTVKSDVDFELWEIEVDEGTAGRVKHWVYVLDQPATVSHEEHRTIELPAGIYEQKQEIEEDPFTEQQRYVVD